MFQVGIEIDPPLQFRKIIVCVTSFNYCETLVPKLLFHRVGLSGISPFDEAMTRLAKGHPIKIVSPYIGLRYLQRLVGLSSSWSLISDLEAWLSSLSGPERTLTTQFIGQNCEQIRHFPAIHAKTVIGSATAYLGSANLTAAGVLMRTELGVFLDEPEMVLDLHSWFDALWHATSAPVMTEVLAYAQELDEQSRQHRSVVVPQPLSFGGERVRARLEQLSEGAPTKGLEPFLPELPGEGDLSQQVEVPKSPPAFLDEGEREPGVAVTLAAVQPLDASKSIEVFATPASLSERRSLPEDLDVAVLRLIEKLARFGFTLQDFVRHARNAGISSRTVVVYRELARYCGNLPRSVFSLDTVNRLTYSKGVFRQSTALDLAASLAPHDAFLEFLIEHLSFSEARGLVGLTHTGVSARKAWTRRWSNDLKEAGVIVEDTAATKATPGTYRLSKKFEWVRRWRLFEGAHRAWEKKLKASRGGVPLSNIVALAAGKQGYAGGATLVRPESAGAYREPAPASSQDQSLSIYARTPVQKALPPIVATTVSPPSRTARGRLDESVTHDYLTYRADLVYLQLFKMLSNSKNSFQVSRNYLDVVHRISKITREPVEFIRLVLEARSPYLPAAASVVATSEGCAVTPHLPAVAAYSRTSALVNKILRQGHPWRFGSSAAPSPLQLPRRPILRVPATVNLEPVTKLIAHRFPAGASADSGQAVKVDDAVAYMQRVASIFMSPGN